MTYDPQKHHRKSIRLKEYDYSKPNAYFITICTYNKECIFGAIINGEMQLNEFGRPTSHSIPTIIRSFKAATTKQIHEIQKTHRQTVWQPRFYEHIIRNPHELDQTREYIINNPLKWALDSENPDNKK